jgi:hypothetical protein
LGGVEMMRALAITAIDAGGRSAAMDLRWHPCSMRPLAILAAAGVAVSLNPAFARAANCKAPEISTPSADDPSKSYCCAPGTTFAHGDCMSATAPQRAAAEAAADGSKPGEAAKAAPPLAIPITVIPVLTCSDGAPCKNAHVSVDGEGKPATEGASLEFVAHRDAVRIDVQAEGYEDFTTHLPVVPNEVVTLRAPLRRLRNLRVVVEASGGLDAFENVYVERDDVPVASCTIRVPRGAIAKGVPPECAMSVPFGGDEDRLRLHLTGVVNLNPPDDIPLTAAGTTTVKVTLHKAAPSPWNLVVPALLTVAAAGVIIAGTKTGDTWGDGLLVTGGGLTAVDMLLGGYLLANWFAPATDASLVVRGVGPDRTLPASAVVASMGTPRSGIRTALGPTGLIVRW